MFLSVITVNLNNVQGIRRTLASVVEQTYADFEWIFIDGESSDGSFEIAKEYLNKLEHYKICSEKDSGIYDAMNKGIELSRGEWILFLNSGDSLVNSSVLMDVSDYLKVSTSSWATGAVRLTREGKPFSIQHHLPFGPGSLAMGLKVVPHQATLVKRMLALDMKGFRTNFGTEADQEFIFRVATCCGEPEIIPLLITDFEVGGIGSQKSPGHFIFAMQRARRLNKKTLMSNILLDTLATYALFVLLRAKIAVNKLLKVTKIKGHDWT